MQENKCVVYLHERKDKPGHIFYCGSGRLDRPNETSSRNNYWWNIVNKHGYNVYIIAEGLTKEESLCLEGFIGREYQEVGMCEACFQLPTDGVHTEMSQEIKDKISKIARDSGRSVGDKNPSSIYIKTHGKHWGEGENNPWYGTKGNNPMCNLIWITNLETLQEKKVKEEDLPNFLNSGWVRARLSLVGNQPTEATRKKLSEKNSGKGNAMYGVKWMTNGVQTKAIKKNEIEIYLAQGWSLGRKLKV